MIFCVEDDDGVRNMMLYTLHASGFEAEGFSDGDAFWAAIQKEIPSLVLLDIMLPGTDGMKILRALRASAETASVPVIMATAKGTEYDKVIGLDTGADDYLVKPFGMMEMVSRVRAVLRRTAPRTEREALSARGIEMNLEEHIVRVRGKPIQLTLKEFELLHLFLANPGQVFSREALIDRIWRSDYLGETRTVDVHVGTLRTKLGDCADCIETVRGVGYKMEPES